VTTQDDRPHFIELDGKRLRLSHLPKVLFPEDGITKAELLLYYQTVAPVLIPHLRGRPVTLKAFPNGVKERPYYRRRLAENTPKWLSRVEIEDRENPVIEDVADLLWVVNKDSVEIHSWLSRRESLHNPDLLVFDLDPGPRIPFSRLCEAAMVVKEALDALGVESFPKTSGANGLHVLVGFQPEFDFEEVHTWVIAVDRVLAGHRPDLFTMDYTRSRRTDKVLLDHNQVGYGRTTASIYSVRPLPGAPVSAPLLWSEVESGEITPGQFTIKTLPERLGKMGDLAAAVNGTEQRLPHI
jgi:bifunctional non-homologous end joining protein LigD